eukprot:CAMPEP_0170643164 /NCGR_PEP_ID=MMETSP0224-20130122/41732_1 /TAXON_ID=285029 /ORGANISM="Togula jolla, Strain CCCM 725" /LENGTH=30 /DNA_ID= /DNA_START= /DNA_END= /DNA_ORIENTATION=
MGYAGVCSNSLNPSVALQVDGGPATEWVGR